MNNILSLPTDCFTHIIKYLPIQSFFTCFRVSKDFQSKFNNSQNIRFLINKYLQSAEKSSPLKDLKIHEISSNDMNCAGILRIIFCYSRLKLLNSEIQELGTLERVIQDPGFEEIMFKNYIEGCTLAIRSLSLEHFKELNFEEKIDRLVEEFTELYSKLIDHYKDRTFSIESSMRLNSINNEFKKIFNGFSQKRKSKTAEIENSKRSKLE